MNICLSNSQNVMWVLCSVCDSMNKKIDLNVCLGGIMSMNINVSKSKIMSMGMSECRFEWNYE